MKENECLSICFEGLFATGKTTVIHRLTQEINTSVEQVWIGHGHHFSLRKSAEEGLDIKQWILRRITTFQRLESMCDLLLIERCAFSDFSNLCFRRNMISPESLWKLNQEWWPQHVIVIQNSPRECLTRIQKRGDYFRADLADLEAFEQAIQETVEFLGGRLFGRLITTTSTEEAYSIGLDILRRRKSKW